MTGQQVQQIDPCDILNILLHGELQVEGLLPYSSNYTLLSTVEHQSMQVLAVYKPRKGERPLWDFPRGTLYQREVAAYVVCEALGFGFVPPTVVRDGPYGIGAVQFYIENDEESHLFTMQREGCYEQDIRRLAAFDYLINNADRKSGHCLKGIDRRLWAIDHGIAFHMEYKLRTVLWDYVGQPFADDVLSALRHFQDCLDQGAPVAHVLEELLNPIEMRTLRQRLYNLVATGVYPEPGPGPNVPWPPV
jgi:uncharacterized repeat protein (TIGR03843 family)